MEKKRFILVAGPFANKGNALAGRFFTSTTCSNYGNHSPLNIHATQHTTGGTQ